MDFGTAKDRDGRGPSRRGTSRFSTSSRDNTRSTEASLVSSKDRLIIPAGSRKAALVHLALEAWRVDLLHPKVLGEVRGTEPCACEAKEGESA